MLMVVDEKLKATKYVFFNNMNYSDIFCLFEEQIPKNYNALHLYQYIAV